MAGRDATRSFMELCEAFAKQGMPRPLGPPMAFGPRAVAFGPKAPAPAPRPPTPKAGPPTPPSSSSSGEESSEESSEEEAAVPSVEGPPETLGAASSAPGLEDGAADMGGEGPAEDDAGGVTEDLYQLPDLSDDEAAVLPEALVAASSAPDLEDEAADMSGDGPADSLAATHSGDGSGAEEDAPIEEGSDGDEGESENAFRKRLRLQSIHARPDGVARAERSHNQFRGGARGQGWRLWMAAPRPILLRPVGSQL